MLALAEVCVLLKALHFSDVVTYRKLQKFAVDTDFIYFLFLFNFPI